MLLHQPGFLEPALHRPDGITALGHEFPLGIKNHKIRHLPELILLGQGGVPVNPLDFRPVDIDFLNGQVRALGRQFCHDRRQLHARGAEGAVEIDQGGFSPDQETFDVQGLTGVAAIGIGNRRRPAPEETTANDRRAASTRDPIKDFRLPVIAFT